jgi:hypothetical protein
MTSRSSGSSIRLREDPDAPGCLPGLRPDRVRDERFFAGFFAHGASDDGGREEFDESAANPRSSSAIRSVNLAITAINSPILAFSARSCATSARRAAFSAASCATDRASDTTTPCPTPAHDQLDTPTSHHMSSTSNDSTS